MRRYEGDNELRPSAAQLYLASVMACFLTFLIGLALIALTEFFNDPERAFEIIVAGGTGGLMLTAFFAFFIIAPYASLLGIILVRIFPRSIWLGAAHGAMLTSLLLAVLFALGSGLPEAYELPWYATLIAIAAFSGWVVQTYILRWPDLRGPDDFT